MPAPRRALPFPVRGEGGPGDGAAAGLPFGDIAGPPAGRYVGETAACRVELRLDPGAGRVSGDVFRRWPQGEAYVFSFCNAGGPAGGLAFAPRDIALHLYPGNGEQGQARLRLTPRAGDRTCLSALLLPAASWHHRGDADEIEVLVRHEGPTFRRLSLEIECEHGLAPPPVAREAGRGSSLCAVLAGAGVELVEAGERSTVDPAGAPWGQAQLHALMSDLAQTDLAEPDWSLRMLWLSTSTRPGLLGVMFDPDDTRPRQGMAIFAKAVEPGPMRDTRLLHTAVHELGHALNLVHRFESPPGQAHSLSPMNYDWRYEGGGGIDAYWQRFAFAFDRDELDFLRHAPLEAIQPGRARFGAGIGQEDGSPPFALRHPAFELSLSTPEAGPVFQFGQPIFLQVALANRGDTAVPVDRRILDLKAGFLSIFLVDEAERHRSPSRFVPFAARCYGREEAVVMRLKKNAVIADNVNLAFGASGFPVRRPGRYLVHAVLYLPLAGPGGSLQTVPVPSPPLAISVIRPQSREEERDSEDMLQDSAGTYLALGGSRARALQSTAESLRQLMERRGRDRPADALAGAIRRCRGLDLARDYLRFEAGDGRPDRCRMEAGNPAAAAAELDAVGDAAARFLDPHSRLALAHLRRKYRQAAET